MSISNLLVNGNDFSVPVESHKFFKSHDFTLHASFHWHDWYHYQKSEHVIVMITWSGNATISRKTISVINHLTYHQLQIMPFIRLVFICQCCMIIHHATHNQNWKKRYGFHPNKKPWSSPLLRPGRKYAVILCNDFGVIYPFYFVPCVILLKGHMISLPRIPRWC